ncbi:SMP-30/gluconolactonase/LRE family protein [Atlantibacter sp.]|uniref:SMP-30/gluconolactonase/LRE family protein n=1 Tax=Atlantibacter sp. TaxID=1903473 RepID=UPI0028A6381A|nr:SMP-30/gluconolactonase/LRE family protein [Atlantibacter sp.]
MCSPFVNAPVVVGQYRALLGETPIWCVRSQSLLWVDILQQRLLRYWPMENQRLEAREMPPFTSAVLLTQRPETFLIVSQCGIRLYDYASGGVEPYCDYPETATGTRPNEAAIAPDGALWFSTMDPVAEKALGSWYRLARDDNAPQRLLSQQWVPNTLHWYGDHIWFADSFRKRFYCADSRTNALTSVAVHPVEGVPDGSALTTNGQLINARWGQSRLVRYQLDGRQLIELDSLPLPVLQPSSCTFGGPTLSDLYITSARQGLSQPSETDGALLCVPTALTGVPARYFRL